MRAVIFMVALAICDLAKTDLSDSVGKVVALFFMFLIMDSLELVKKVIGRYEG